MRRVLALVAVAGWTVLGHAQPADTPTPAALALTWDADTTPEVIQKWPDADWSGARTLSFPATLAKPTSTRIEFMLLSPDAANGYSLGFAADWEGRVPMELDRKRFRAVGKPLGWERICGLRLRATELRRPGTVLSVGGITPLSRTPVYWISECEDALECLWCSELMDLSGWKLVDSSAAAGTCGVRPYWCWAEFFIREDPGRRERLVFEHAYDIDVSAYDRISVRAAIDRDGFLSAAVNIDGQWLRSAPFHAGKGAFEELEIPIAGKHLDAVRLDWSEPEDQPGGPAGKEICSTVQWIAAHRKGMPPRPVVQPPPMIAPRTAPFEDLLTHGLPAGVLFGRADIPALRDKISRDPGKRMWQQIKARADQYLKLEPEKDVGEYTPDWHPCYSRRADRFSRAWCDAIDTLAFAYVLSGDMRYADMARRVMLSAAACRYWTYDFFNRRPVGWSGLGSIFIETWFAGAMSKGYDWIHNTLTPEEREIIARAILDKGVLWSEEAMAHREYLKSSNQGVVLIQGVAMAGIVLGQEYPEARPLPQKSLDYMNLVIGNLYDLDGGCDEGAGYSTFTLTDAVPASMGLIRNLGPETREKFPPAFRRAIDFSLAMRSMTRPTYASLNFNDSHFGGGLPPRVPLFFATTFRDPGAQWIYQSLYADNPPGCIYSLLLYDEQLAASPPVMDKAKRFRGSGYVFLRSGWNVGDTLIALESGPVSRGHHHQDKNHFILEALGERMIVDPGVIDYGDPACNQYKQTLLHNTLTFDGADQKYPADRQAARVTALMSTEGLDLVVSDAAPSYPAAETALRHIFFFRPNLVAVLDHAAAKSPARIAWNLHPSAPPERAGDLWTSTFQSGARLLVKVAGGEALDQETFPWPTDVKGVTAYHLALFPKERTKEARFLAFLAPVAKDEPVPALSQPKVDGGDALLACGQDGAEDLVLAAAATSAAARCGDTELSGTAAAIRRTKTGIAGFAVEHATRISVGGRILFATATPANAAFWRTSQGAWYGRVGSPVPITATAGFGQTGDCWRREGTRWLPLAVRRGPDAIEIEIPATTEPEGVELVLGCPPELDLADEAPPRLVRLAVDGQEYPTTRDADLGATALPSSVVLEVDDANGIDAATVCVDGRAVTNGYRVDLDGARKGARVEIDLRSLLASTAGDTDVPLRRIMNVTVTDRALVAHATTRSVTVLHCPAPGPNARFLSDLTPLKAFAHNGLISDRAYGQGSPHLDGITFRKSVMICPEAPDGRSEAVYAMDGRAAALYAVIGIEDEARPNGSAVFIVESRSAPNAPWIELYRSRTLTGRDNARVIRVALGTATELRLSCTDAGDNIHSDHATWADVRLE